MKKEEAFICINEEVLSLENCRLYSHKLIEKGAFDAELGSFLHFLTDSTRENLEVQTSGSSGPPKIILLSKTQLTAAAEDTIDALQLKKGDNALLALPVNYIGGKMMVMRAVIGGLNLITTKPSNNILTQNLSFDKINYAAFTPSQLYTILNDKKALENLKKIDKVIIGGAAVSGQLLTVLNSLNNRVYETYGMTETLSHIALKMLSPHPSYEFKALKGVTLSADREDCLIINCENRQIENLKTNDVVKMTSANSFIIKGRKDNTINSGGIKIHPEMMEAQLEKLLGREVIISYTTHPKYGQKLMLVLEGAALSEASKAIILKKVCSISGFQVVPKELVVFPFFPRTDNGKKNRKVTAELLKGHH